MGRKFQPILTLPADHPAKLYTRNWHEISRHGELLVHENKIIVPINFRKILTKILHSAHQGINKTTTAACQLYSWPGMQEMIKREIAGCKKCLELSPSQPPQPLQTMSATKPWEQVGLDLFECNQKHYLSIVDRFSGYPWIIRLRKLCTSNVTSKLDELTHEFGDFFSCLTDNGPQFRSQFTTWCKSKGIIHLTSSPYHAQSTLDKKMYWT